MKNDVNFNSNIKKYELDNGVTVLIEEMPFFQSVSLGFFLKRGSRDENKNQVGYSHFCEHMLFKGTNIYKKDEIAHIFDQMGGYINAYTNHESVVIYNRVPYFHLDEAIKLMFDMFHNSIFEESETELERDVILNEINMTLEDPQDKIFEDFMNNLFPNQGLGLPIIGSIESISNVSQKTLFDFYKNMFCSDDLIIAISGKINTEKTLSLIESFSFRRDKKQTNVKACQGNERDFFTESASEQLHLLVGTGKFDLTDDSFIHAGLLNIILGESMSSRFFQKLREDLGLCYSIHSFLNKYRDESLFGLYMSIMPKNTKKAIDATSSVIKELLKNGITKNELEHAKKQKIGEIILNTDVLQKRMQRIAMMEIKYGRHYDENYIINKIEKTTLDDVNKLIHEIFICDNFITQALYKKKIEIEKWSF
jgi:predicted Zn-dependent peptidase